MSDEQRWDDPELEGKTFADFDPRPKKQRVSDQQALEIEQQFEQESRIRTVCTMCEETVTGSMETIREHMATCQTEFLTHEPPPERDTISPVEQALEGCGVVSCERCGRRIRGTWTKYQSHLRMCVEGAG